MPEDVRKTGSCSGGDAAKLREDAEQIGPAIAILLFFANLYPFLSSSTPILFRVYDLFSSSPHPIIIHPYPGIFSFAIYVHTSNCEFIANLGFTLVGFSFFFFHSNFYI
jgi:hypothetical protein